MCLDMLLAQAINVLRREMLFLLLGMNLVLVMMEDIPNIQEFQLSGLLIYLIV